MHCVQAAEHRGAGDDVVAGLDRAHLGTDRLDHAGRFVAGDGGTGAGDRALHEVQVAVAHPAGDGPDPHLVGAGSSTSISSMLIPPPISLKIAALAFMSRPLSSDRPDSARPGRQRGS